MKNFIKRLIHREDIAFDLTRSGESELVETSTGEMQARRKINSDHIPVPKLVNPIGGSLSGHKTISDFLRSLIAIWDDVQLLKKGINPDNTLQAVTQVGASTTNSVQLLGATQQAKLFHRVQPGLYTFVQDDAGVMIDVDNIVTFTPLEAGTVLRVYNTTNAPVAITLAGVTVVNKAHTKISANGTIELFYQDANTVRLTGESEA